MLTNSLNNEILANETTVSRSSTTAVECLVQSANIASSDSSTIVESSSAVSASYSQLSVPSNKIYTVGMGDSSSTDFNIVDVTSLPGSEVTEINSTDAVINSEQMRVTLVGAYAKVENGTANNCVVEVKTAGTGRPNLCCYRGAGRNGFWYYNDALSVMGWGGYPTGSPPREPPTIGQPGYFNLSGSFIRSAHPWVFARQVSDVANVTGDGTDYAMVAGNVALQQPYWNSPTYTAGVTGVYHVACQIRWALNGSTATSGTVRIVSTSRTLVACNFDTATRRTQSTVTVNVAIPLTAGDTWQVRLQLNGGTKVVTYLGNPLRTTICAWKVS